MGREVVRPVILAPQDGKFQANYDRIVSSRLTWETQCNPISKFEIKNGWGYIAMVEHLLSVWEGLGSASSTQGG